MNKATLLLAASILLSPAVIAQTLFVPSGTAGVGSSSTGNVGVGLSNPSAKLTLSTATTNDGLALFGTNGTWVTLYANLGTGSFNGISSTGDRGILFGGSAAGSTGGGFIIAPWASATSGLRIDGSGNVGVGTVSPTARLEIKGPSTWQGTVRVNTGGPSQYSSYGWMIGDVLKWSAYVHYATTPADGLLFANAAGQDCVEFAQNGMVGIGTVTPGYRLDVRNTGDAQIAAVETSSGNYNRVIVGANANESYLQELYSSYARPLTFKINGEMMRLDVTGNLGVGTTAPGARLEVNGPTSGLPATSGTNQANGSLRVANAQTGGVLDLGVAGGATAAAWLQYTNRSDLSQSYALLLNPNGGNVGIGTTNPTQKLSVNGAIQAKEVIVQTGWSDYVFRSDYRLAPLSEVEGAIQKDGHLPGIPSAKEVAEQGISLGDMQAKLLAKLEEVTLHLIAQEKKIEQLQTENATLRAQVGALAAQH